MAKKNVTPRKVRRSSMTVRNAKSVTIRRNPNGTIAVKVSRKRRRK